MKADSRSSASAGSREVSRSPPGSPPRALLVAKSDVYSFLITVLLELVTAKPPFRA